MAQPLSFSTGRPFSAFSPRTPLQAPAHLWGAFGAHAAAPWDRVVLHYRHTLAQRQAAAFCQALTSPQRLSVAALSEILQAVGAHGLTEAFERALPLEAARHGQHFPTVAAALASRLGKNRVQAFFNRAPQKALLGKLYPRTDAWVATPWEDRRYGMWLSIANFVAVCQKHPVMSTAVIGSVGFLGHRYPFLGGLSGLGIILWGGGASLVHEVRAKQSLRHSPAQRAAHYRASGENLAAVLVTLLGVKGIYHGTASGWQKAQAMTAARPMTAGNLLRGAWEAIKARPEAAHKTNLLESVLFVSGLFDNVLLPFNALADRLGAAGPSPKNRS